MQSFSLWIRRREVIFPVISLKSSEEGRLVLPKYRENSSCFSLCWLCLSFVICLFLQSRSSDCSSCLFQAFRYHPSMFFLLTFLCAVPTIQATVARPAPACEGHALLRAERRVRFEVVFTILASAARERWFTRDRRPSRVYTSSKLNKIIYCSLVPCSFSSWSWNEALLNSREADMKMEEIDIQWGRSIQYRGQKNRNLSATTPIKSSAFKSKYCQTARFTDTLNTDTSLLLLVFFVLGESPYTWFSLNSTRLTRTDTGKWGLTDNQFRCLINRFSQKVNLAYADSSLLTMGSKKAFPLRR